MAAGVGGYSHVHLIPHLEGLDQRREIGRGSFGAVYEVKMNGLPCIAKGLHDILLGHGGNISIREAEKEAIMAKFHDECALLGNLKHPNIVQFLGVHQSKDNDEWLMMEYLHMDLAKCLKMYPDIPLPLKLSILRDVSYGLLHLHSQAPPIIHRDLTAPNILLTQGMSAKIADLGVSKIFDIRQLQQSAHTAAPGTWAYMPPEALSPDPKYDAKLDVFSYGVLTLYVAIQGFPTVYELQTTSLVYKDIQINKRKPWVDKMGVSHPLHNVVMSCLKDRPDHRPTSKELNDIITKLCAQHENSCKNVLEASSAVAQMEDALRRAHEENKLLEQRLQEAKQASSAVTQMEDALRRAHEENKLLEQRLQEAKQVSAAKTEKFLGKFSDHNNAIKQSRALVEESKHSAELLESSQKELAAVHMSGKAVGAACKWSPSMGRKRPIVSASRRQLPSTPPRPHVKPDHRAQQTTLSVPSQSEDLMTFSVASKPAGPQTTSIWHGSAVGMVGWSPHPSTGYDISPGSAANWSSTPYEHTSQIRPQKLPIAPHKYVPTSSPTQLIIPGSTSTQPIVPGFTFTQPIVPGSQPAHLNALAHCDVIGTQPSTIAHFPSSGTKVVGLDTFPITAGKSSAHPVLPYSLPTPSQQCLPSNKRPSPQQYRTSSAYGRSSQDISPCMAGTRQVSQTPKLAPTPMTPSPISPLPIAPSSLHTHSTTAGEQSSDIFSTTNDVVENSTPLGLGPAIMGIFGHNSGDSETQPQDLKEQKKVISSNQLARQHSLTYKQIELHLIEDLPEGGKAAVYEALNRRAQAEALVGCDDITSILLYREAAALLSALQQSPDIIHNDQLRMQIAGCHQNIVDWLNQSSSCSKCGKTRRLDEGLLCGPCCLKERKQAGITTYA